MSLGMHMYICITKIMKTKEGEIRTIIILDFRSNFSWSVNKNNIISYI